MKTTELTSRLYEREDLPGVLHLWEESGWGGLTVEHFNKWFFDTPYGDCIIVIAADEKDEVIGQLSFTPTRLYVRGNEIKTLRIAASVIRKDFHFSGTDFQDFPISKMFRYGISIAVQRNFSLAYIFPAKGWLRAAEATSNSHTCWETSTFDGFSISLDSPLIGHSVKE